MVSTSEELTARHAQRADPAAGEVANTFGMLDYRDQFRKNQSGMSQVDNLLCALVHALARQLDPAIESLCMAASEAASPCFRKGRA